MICCMDCSPFLDGNTGYVDLGELGLFLSPDRTPSEISSSIYTCILCCSAFLTYLPSLRLLLLAAREGNIPGIFSATTVFRTPGTYAYRDQKYGNLMTGTVYVSSESGNAPSSEELFSSFNARFGSISILTSNEKEL
jgi:hypothetical protein